MKYINTVKVYYIYIYIYIYPECSNIVTMNSTITPEHIRYPRQTQNRCHWEYYRIHHCTRNKN